MGAPLLTCLAQIPSFRLAGADPLPLLELPDLVQGEHLRGARDLAPGLARRRREFEGPHRHTFTEEGAHAERRLDVLERLAPDMDHTSSTK